MSFGERLLELRKEHNMTQEDLANKIHVTRQTISKWELDMTVPDMDILIDLSQLFQISIDELVGNAEKNASTDIKKEMKSYEYVSKKKLFGIPLVHIHFGIGLYRAKGIIAIGNIATGVISIGFLSIGLLSLGLLSLALISLGCLSLGILLAFGSISIGCIAFGGVAIGIITFGGVSIGVYALGGCAVAKNIACGGYARGRIAIGDVCDGLYTFHINESGRDFTREELHSTILQEFPNLWTFIVDIFCNFG